MPEKPELDVVIERLDNIIRTNAKEHKQIIEQVEQTNGSVADIQKWRFMVTGALIVMNIFLVPIIVAMVIKGIVEFLF